MIPKVETCIDAVENGVEGVVILNGKTPHVVLLELFTEHGAGTLIVPLGTFLQATESAPPRRADSASDRRTVCAGTADASAGTGTLTTSDNDTTWQSGDRRTPPR